MKETKEQRQNYHQNCKLIVHQKYGGKCVHCGENDLAVLTIDHINDDGNTEKHRDSSRKFYYELRTQPLREDLQILCFNCNWRKRIYGSDMSQWDRKKVDTTKASKTIRNYSRSL